MSKKDLTVITPHPDDELIGCYSLFMERRVKEVIYVKDLLPDRIVEAQSFCDLNKVDAVFLDSLYELIEIMEDEDAKFIVPSPNDRHMLHKALGSLFISYGVAYGIYSVDMTGDYVQPLSVFHQNNKKNWLDTYYPSQKSLWEMDHRYYLFEGITFLKENKGD